MNRQLNEIMVKLNTRNALAVLAVALLFSTTFGAESAIAKPLIYKFSGGSMYTLEYSEIGFADTSATTRWGRITKSGRVVPLTTDLGLKEVSEAVYSPFDGDIYVLAEAQGFDCEVWSFDPANPQGTLSKRFTVSNPDFIARNCTSLAFHPEVSGQIVVGYLTDANDFDEYFAGFHDDGTGDFIGYANFALDSPSAMDCMSQSKCLSIFFDMNRPYFYYVTATTFRVAPIRGTPWISSVRFDGARQPWVAQWTPDGDSVGKLSLKTRRVTWGKKLVDSVTGLPWRTGSLVFVPRSG